MDQELDPDFILGKNNAENERQITLFIATCRELFALDNISQLTDVDIRKFLIARGGHRGKALESISNTLVWRQQIQIDDILKQDCTEANSSGRVQFFGKARDGSTILVFQGSRHVPLSIETETRFILYTLESAKKCNIITDKLTVIFDRSGIKSHSKADIKLFGTIVPILQNNYPEILARCYIFPTGTLFWMMWGLSGTLIEPATLAKVVYLLIIGYNNS